VGYRGQPRKSVTWSATVFHTDYDHLRTLEIAPSGTFAEFANEMDGTTSGVETWATYQATANWRIGGGFTTLDKDLQLKPGSDGLNGGVSAEGNDPEHSWHLRSSHDLSEQWELDVIVRGIASLPNPAVPHYVAADIRLGWKLRRDLELSLTGRNLGGSHAEFRDPLVRAEFESSFFLKVVARL
jgi:iron complex outermembrane receptor protein